MSSFFVKPRKGKVMGFFRKRREKALSEPNVSEEWITGGHWLEWETPLNLVRGESYRPKTLLSLAGPPCEKGYLVPVKVVIRRDPNNKYDSNALRAEVKGNLVGYIAKEVAAQLSPALDRVRCEKFSVAGVIRGGSLKAPNLGCHVWMKRRLSLGPVITLMPEIEEQFEVSWPPELNEGRE